MLAQNIEGNKKNRRFFEEKLQIPNSADFVYYSMLYKFVLTLNQ